MLFLLSLLLPLTLLMLCFWCFHMGILATMLLLASPEVPVVFSVAVNPAGADVLPAVDVPSVPTVATESLLIALLLLLTSLPLLVFC
jgi:hypothetical protein